MSGATCAPQLQMLFRTLEAGRAADVFDFDPAEAMAPLPRAHHWADGSAYVNHVELVRKARGVEMPPSFWTEPLIYQGGSDDLLGAHDDVPVASEEYGIDLEAEVAVITDDVPMGTDARRGARPHSPADAGQRLVAAQPDPGRAAEGFRFLPVEAGDLVLAGRGDPGRARRRLGRKQGASSARKSRQRPPARAAGRGNRHDVRFPHADRARGTHAPARRGFDPRVRHGVEL